MYQTVSEIYYPVLQSSAEKRFGRYFIDRNNKENILIYQSLKSQEALERAAFSQAHDLFIQRMQPLQNELTILQLKHTKPELNDDNMDSDDIDSPSEVTLIDMHVMLRKISKALHSKGNFYDPRLFDAAMVAYKNNNGAVLFDIWERVVNSSQRQDVVTTEDEDEKYVQSLRLCNYINIAIHCLNKEIEYLENNELLQKYKNGTEDFNKYIKNEEKKLQNQIERFKSKNPEEGGSNV